MLFERQLGVFLTRFIRAYDYDASILVRILRVHTTTLHKLVMLHQQCQLVQCSGQAS
jgi:hypothetical protein